MAHKGEIILEFISKGTYVQINAIDVVTGTEASVIAPKTLPRFEMENLARRKLEYVMRKSPSSPLDDEDETLV
jgi:hypothetical protein